MNRIFILSYIILLLNIELFSQSSTEGGAWYMYFWNMPTKSAVGMQGDVQYRNWNIIGDLEQLLLRGGMTYSPKKAKVKFTLGYAHITSGKIGGSKSTTWENRFYQEILYPSKIGNRIYLNHRIRYEQRLVQNQNFRTRYRYNLFVNIPLNNVQLQEKTIYIALYNELFINGQKQIGDGLEVSYFDRNRLYGGLGYVLSKGIKIQLGVMNQTGIQSGKNQLQFSLHHKF